MEFEENRNMHIKEKNTPPLVHLLETQKDEWYSEREKLLKSNEKLLKEIKTQKDWNIHETDYRMFYAYKSSAFEK